MSLHIVIVNYKTPRDLNDCLSSLAEHEPTVDYEVVVVNNTPTDEDVKIANKWCEPRGWGVMNFNENFGYAKACNVASLRREPDVFGFFNADVMFTHGTLDACHDALVQGAETDNWGVLGPRQVDQSGAITHAGIFGTHERPQIRGWKNKTSDYQSVEEAISVSGSAYFVHRRAWYELYACPTFRRAAPTALGAFLPTPHYYEETWVSYHAHAHGYKVMYWGLHTMIHKWHKASAVGGEADRKMPQSQRLFREACEVHDIAHD